MTNNNELRLVPISELLVESFFIPGYQRGYRWNRRQVLELLNDVYEFRTRPHHAEGEFYCLQPLVVREMGSSWELVDGQQRLITILLILRYLNQRFAESFRKKLYEIEYQTRPDSQAYLESLDERRKDENIDFHHMYEAYSEIEEWFKDKVNHINDIESAFLNDVKVIWYQISKDAVPIEVFTRLNMGKIPLTNAELVKALFLKSSNFQGEGDQHQVLLQLKIAQEWDDIEKQLQSDQFWYFISNDAPADNRISYILERVAKRISTTEIPERDPHYTFLTFHRHFLEQGSDVEQEWASIKKYFMTLREWYDSRFLYHVVGFLVEQGISVAQIMDLRDAYASKHDFNRALIRRTFEEVFPDIFDEDDESDPDFAKLEGVIATELLELDYQKSHHRGRIRSILLLFNIASLLEETSINARFEFDRFKTESWDLEHIRSVVSEMPESIPKQKRWLTDYLDYFDSPELEENEEEYLFAEEVREILDADTFDQEQFGELYEVIVNHFDPSPTSDSDHQISNLTLLDRGTNRSYQNAIFPIKRKQIIALDRKAVFVPLCTKNAFLKFYSEKVDKMLVWQPSDATCYERAIVTKLLSLWKSEAR